MTYFLITLHVIVCIALIIIVLLQAGKGAEIGASFGAGSSQTVFGAGGGKSFMTRMTTGAAVIFMLTSLTLTYFYSEPTTVMPATVPRTDQGTSPVPLTGTPAQLPTEVTQPGKVEQEQQAAPPVENQQGAPAEPRN
ncbi:MAG: preprotein translocase subunit SecG [Desulfuromonadales bacterium]|nr:preprotein translocase subunit SecG [Desulfuromonadales bacterium]